MRTPRLKPRQEAQSDGSIERIVRETASARIVYEVVRESPTRERHPSRSNETRLDSQAGQRIAALRLLNSLSRILTHSTFGGADRRQAALAIAADVYACLSKLQGDEFNPSAFSAWAEKNVPGVKPKEIDAAIGGPVAAQRPSPAAVGCALHVTWDEWIVLRPWGVWPEGASAQDVEDVRASVQRERCRMRKREARGGLKRDPSVETISAASKRLGHSRTTLYAWREQGRLALVNGLWTEVKTEHNVRLPRIKKQDAGQNVQRKRPRRQPSGRDSQMALPTFKNLMAVAQLFDLAIEVWRRPAAAPKRAAAGN